VRPAAGARRETYRYLTARLRRPRVFTPGMSHFTEAQDLLRTDDKGSGYFPPVSPENVAPAQVHAVLQVAEHLGNIVVELSEIRQAMIAPRQSAGPPRQPLGRPGAHD
jgi:hypothetical protein